MKKIYFLFILSIFSLNLHCQIYWEKHPGNPLMAPGSSGEWDDDVITPGPVIYYDSTYHMWYTGSWSNPRIGYATSTDGITWTKDANNPVLGVGPDGTWDDNWVAVGDVLIIDSVFHMWYTGHDGTIWNANYRIGHATSPDGVTWTKDTVNNPVLDIGPLGDWDDTFIVGGSVVYDSSEYHMWYEAWNGTENQVRIGHATSPDGVIWTKDSLNPVLTYEAGKWDYPTIKSPMVIFDGYTYRMWYTGGSQWGGVGWNWQIGYATSEDGSVWTKYGNNPVLRKGSTGSWESNFVIYPSVIDSSGVKYKMWYSGGPASEKGSIGYAESDARLPALWVKNKMLVDPTDTLAAEIHKDGIIYIVPEGTSPVNDSISKYMLASVDALAGTEVNIPLTDFSLGQYTVVAVSNAEFVSPNPFLLRVVDDAKLPALTLAEDTVSIGDPISVTSSKDGTVYLFKAALPPDISLVRNPNFLIDSLTAAANIPGEFPTTGLYENYSYYLYAVDIYGQFSGRGTVRVESIVGVEETADAGLHIYPNPVQNVLHVNLLGKSGELQVFDISGKCLMQKQITENENSVDVSGLGNGIYFVRVMYDKQILTGKIVKY